MDQNTLETLQEKINEVPASVPEHLSGEPVPARTTALFLVVRILGRMAGFVLLAIITAPLWPLYWLGALLWGSPPNVPKLWQVRLASYIAWCEKTGLGRETLSEGDQ